MHFLFYYRAAELTKSTGRLTQHSSCRRWGHLSSPSHRAALRGRRKQTREMKSVYAESRSRNVDTKLNQWGETTWISGLTARRSQSAPLIDRQHFDLQQWLLHGDTNHNTDINTKQGGRKRTFKSSDTSHPAFFLVFSSFWSCALILQGQIPNTFTTSCSSLFSFAHPLVSTLDGFHGCCVNCLLLSLLWFSVPSSLHPSLCWFSSPLCIVKELGQGAAKIPVLYDLFFYFSFTTFHWHTHNYTQYAVHYTELPLPVCSKYRMFWFSVLILS